MLTGLVRRQLVAFVAVSLLGTAYVGARYARLDRLFLDTSYDVTARFHQSGGIFTGAEVSYRGVEVGTVSDLRLTRAGVDVILRIDHSWRAIPADTIATVANKSAVGEQYVDLEPRTDRRPYLKDGSVIAARNTVVPVSPAQVLTSVDRFVTSVPHDSLRTTVSELGNAFHGSRDDLAQMIDSSDHFLQAAADNFDVTTALINDSRTVLRTQATKGSDIRSFSRDLALFSATFAHHDRALRQLIDNGSASVGQLRAFLEDNGVDLGELVNNLVTTGDVVVKHIPGIRQVLVLYPYVVASGYTMVVKGPDGYQTRSGFVLNSQPALCHDGYDPAEQRPPTDGSNRSMDEDAHCADPPAASDPRGSQNAPRVAPSSLDPPVATYDVGVRELTWSDGDHLTGHQTAGHGVSLDALGWLLLGPVASSSPAL